ncbi:MAG: hypothetical protein MI867_14140, partial [Pseudomonadales bacterium]|nr:hypothetical protein [Pseudomonadales bacterium]
TVLLAMAGCKQTVEMQFDLDNPESFYTNGFPTDLRLLENGLIDLSLFPRTSHKLTNLYVTETEARANGYTISMPIYLPFSGPLAVNQLPSDDLAYIDSNSPIQLIDVDPFSPEYGRLFPLKVSMTWQKDSYRPNHLLQVLPTLGLNLRSNNTYALIVTKDIPIKEGHTLTQNPVLGKLLSQETIGGEITYKALSVFAPLRDWLFTSHLSADDIVGATVWTTGDPTKNLFKAAEQISQWPIPKAKDLQLLEEFDDYCVIQGTWQVPGFQAGIAPYAYPVYGGDIQWQENGAPIVQYHRDTPMIVTIPNQPMPENGFPLLMYNHGTGGDAVQVYNRGLQFPDGSIEAGGGPSRIAANRGWASSGMGGHMSMDHLGVLGTLDGYIAYNFLNPVAWLGNLQQMALERVLYRRLLTHLEIPKELCPGAKSNDNNLKFDPDMQVIMGHSLGSYLTGIQTAIDPKPYQGAIWSGAGGSWIEFVFGPTDPIHLQFVAELFAVNLSPIEHMDLWHPIPMLAEMLVGGANNILYTDQILRNPRKTPPHVLVIQGHNDKQVPENIQRPLLTSLGVDLAGNDIGDGPEDSVFTYMQMGGAVQYAYPIGNNKLVGDYGSRTAVTVRYEQDTATDLDGHYVAFQLDAPKHQYGCFLANLSSGKVPIVPEGAAWNGDCF